MKCLGFAAALLTLAPLFSFAAEIPRKAPELEINLPDGKKLNVSDFRGKVVCLAFILTT